MSTTSTTTELSDTMLEVGARLFPRRYNRFKNMRPFVEAWLWAETLDWRQNPYDRYLLRREILLHLESSAIYRGRQNIYAIASREEIAAEVDHLMNEFPDKCESLGVFGYVLVTVPRNLARKHGRITYNKLTAALAKL